MISPHTNRVKKILVLSATAAIIAAGFAWQNNLEASAAVIVTPERIANIRVNCVENQASLNRLHQTDTSLRNNRGNLYRSIGDKLMSPLNARIKSNDLDASKLTKITVAYNDAYGRFFKDYIAYDEALTKLLSVNCTKEPVAFYNALLDAREKRDELSASNKELVRLISEYKKEFDAFHADFLKNEEQS